MEHKGRGTAKLKEIHEEETVGKNAICETTVAMMLKQKPSQAHTTLKGHGAKQVRETESRMTVGRV